MDLPPSIDAYLRAADEVAPGLVVGLHAVGSLALGDFRPAVSDVDLVAVCARRLGDVDLGALAPIHDGVDVTYLTPDDLGRDPLALSPPHAVEGVLHRDSGVEANPIVWRTLATRAVTLRGAPIGPDDVWFDAGALRRFAVDSLATFWTARVDEWRELEEVPEPLVRHERGLSWLVLGIARLHHTIATLDVTSKTGGGEHALGIVAARWHEVLRTAMALRHDPETALSTPPAALRQDAVALATWLIEDAYSLYLQMKGRFR